MGKIARLEGRSLPWAREQFARYYARQKVPPPVPAPPTGVRDVPVRLGDGDAAPRGVPDARGVRGVPRARGASPRVLLLGVLPGPGPSEDGPEGVARRGPHLRPRRRPPPGGRRSIVRRAARTRQAEGPLPPRGVPARRLRHLSRERPAVPLRGPGVPRPRPRRSVPPAQQPRTARARRVRDGFRLRRHDGRG